jgi:hypothetical protein
MNDIIQMATVITSVPVDEILRKTMPFRLKKFSNHPVEPPKWLKLGSFE